MLAVILQKFPKLDALIKERINSKARLTAVFNGDGIAITTIDEICDTGNKVVVMVVDKDSSDDESM